MTMSNTRAGMEHLVIREAVDPARHLDDLIAFHVRQSGARRASETTRVWHLETVHALEELKVLRKRQVIPLAGQVS